MYKFACSNPSKCCRCIGSRMFFAEDCFRNIVSDSVDRVFAAIGTVLNGILSMHVGSSISTFGQFRRILDNTAASFSSIVRPYLRLTCTTMFAYQQRLFGGSHSPASFAIFWRRFRKGEAWVRFSRSSAKSFRTWAVAAHRPESCASERATMCSISVLSDRYKTFHAVG